MPMPNQKGWFAIIFIFLTLAIPFAVTYYVSTDGYKHKFRTWQKKNWAGSIPSKSSINQGKVLLVKNEKVIIDKTCLVFKGLSDDKVTMDLYLLELDPEIPYPLKFTKQSVSDGIWLGNVMYQVVSVKDNVLRLKIQDSYNTF